MRLVGRPPSYDKQLVVLLQSYGDAALQPGSMCSMGTGHSPSALDSFTGRSDDKQQRRTLIQLPRLEGGYSCGRTSGRHGLKVQRSLATSSLRLGVTAASRSR